MFDLDLRVVDLVLEVALEAVASVAVSVEVALEAEVLLEAGNTKCKATENLLPHLL